MAGAVEATGEVSAVIYPTPNDGNFTLVVNTGVQTTSNATVELVDMYGRVVARYSAVNNLGMIYRKIQNNHLMSGVYQVTCKIGKLRLVTRMVVVI
jgi:translation elongation factor EF-Tu-like GTPase